MRTNRSAILVTALLLCGLAILALVPISIAAQDDDDDGERHRHGDIVNIFTSDVVIPEGTIRHGSVISIGRDVRVEGELTGDVIVILGSVTVDGARVHDVIGVLSEIELRNARVRGELLNVAGGLSIDDETDIGGGTLDLGLMGGWFPGFMALLTWTRVLGLLFVFVLLALLVAIAPERVRLIAQETPPRYLAALFVGLLVYVALWTLVFPIALGTVIGLPFLLLAWTAFKWLGIAGVFYSLGSTLGRSMGREMSAMGAVLLIFGINAAILLLLSPLGIFGLILIGLYRTVFFVFVEAPAVGLVLLTRFGTRASTPDTTASAPAVRPEPLPPTTPAHGLPEPRDPSDERND